MTELDQALERYMQDENRQSDYYDLVLNTEFYIPICESDAESDLADKESVTPLLIDSDNKTYLMLFDTEERLTEWARQQVNYVILVGYQVAELSTPELHWAVNIGGQFAKEFVPDEIKWLQQAVEK